MTSGDRAPKATTAADAPGPDRAPEATTAADASRPNRAPEAKAEPAAAAPRLDRARAALILVDLQPDFMPGGALAVPAGDEVIAPCNRLAAAGRFGIVVATQDWHPAGHISFASSHPGRRPFQIIDLYGRAQVLWPDHCLQGTPGAALHAAFEAARAELVLRKGADPLVDSYSAFRSNWNANGKRPPTGLAQFLRQRGARSVVLAGLARDYCVLWSAEDAAAAGFDTIVAWDATRPVDAASDDATRAALAAAGVRALDCAEILRAEDCP